jgi:ribulose-phosphate 3-epimerase
MIEIIPAINCDSFEEIKEKLKKVEPYVEWAQIDVADGTFTKNTLWHDSNDLFFLKTGLKLEVHLMISDIEKRIADWILPQVNRIIFHLESSIDPGFVIDFCKKNEKEVGIAFGPDIPWTQAAAFVKEASFFQVLGVYPGLPGQKMRDGTIDKIRELHKFCPSCIIEVDGGVNESNLKEVTEAGATKIVMANAIFKNEDIQNNIKVLKELISKP